MTALNRFTNLSWSNRITGVLPILGLATTTVSDCALDIATLMRCLSKRKSSPEGNSLASLTLAQEHNSHPFQIYSQVCDFWLQVNLLSVSISKRISCYVIKMSFECN